MTDLHRLITDAVLSGETSQDRIHTAQGIASFAAAALIQADDAKDGNQAALRIAHLTANSP
jgi:hypothetical protein